MCHTRVRRAAYYKAYIETFLKGLEFSLHMQGTIVSFRRGRHTQKTSHMILKVETVEDKDAAEKLVGKKVSWKSPAGKEIKGEVASAHGGNGRVRAIFEKGMPGQSLGTPVEVA